MRRIRKRPRHVVLAVAALAAAAAAALFITIPWNNSPGVLGAMAALTPPAGTILHEKWGGDVQIATNPACTETRGPSEIWIDQEPPHRYRAALLNDLPLQPPLDPRALVCSKGTASELGGTFDPHCSATGCEPSLRFTPPNRLSYQQDLFRSPQGTLRQSFASRSAPDWRTMKGRRSWTGARSSASASTHHRPVPFPAVRVSRPICTSTPTPSIRSRSTATRASSGCGTRSSSAS